MSTKFRVGLLAAVTIVISLSASLFSFRMWYEFYLHIAFNELGRYYDAKDSVVYTDDAFVWAIPAFAFLLLAGAVPFGAVRGRGKGL